ncbi:GDSL-type esterase/lipase family protein [Effusibacillus consociatus]|uniref:GDSL-type esterase/lipase family protein n=1 Tax=Effusibacillus consociatus TaxID=1117041 RepID=A0ABV9Q4B0_9BACL
MQRGKTIWYTIAVTSVASLLLLSSGAILAFQNGPTSATENSGPHRQDSPAAQQMNPVKEESIPAASPADVKGDYRIVALGDSLTRGAGDETGQGYVGYLTTELQKMTKNKVITTNLGINGMKAPELLQYIQSPEVQKEIKAAHLITLSIGGNDLVRGAGPVTTTPNPGLAKQTQDQFLNTLDQILKEIRSQNEQSPILFVGLYNPFPLSDDQQKTALRILEEWNSKTSQVLSKYQHTLLVPTQDLFTWNSSKFLAADNFHPNGQGYKAIAMRMLQDLK